MDDARIPPLLNATSGIRQWLRLWGVSALVWIGLWATHHASLAGPTTEMRQRMTWAFRLTHLGDYMVSATLVLPFLFLVWRLPLDASRWRRSIAGQVLLMAAFSALDVGFCQTVRTALVDWHPAFKPYKQPLLSIWVYNVIVYGVMAAVGWAVQYQREARFREQRATLLEARLAEARLEALRTQLQPHFLFNALNAIAALVRRDPEGAERVIARLSDLLRCSLSAGGAQEVTLKQELDITERYVDIERVRFADRLTVTSSVMPEALDAQVPSLVLQPLVENAIRHGIASRSAPGHVEIAAGREGEVLVLTVRDDGQGYSEEATGRQARGVGLTNTRARIEQLYGARASLHIGRQAKGGTEVTLRIPWRLAHEVPALQREERGAPLSARGDAAPSTTEDVPGPETSVAPPSY